MTKNLFLHKSNQNLKSSMWLQLESDLDTYFIVGVNNQKS